MTETGQASFEGTGLASSRAGRRARVATLVAVALLLVPVSWKRLTR